MARRRCCCPPTGCLIFEDDFNRVDNTDLGSGWWEFGGDWEIASNRLWEAGTANAVALATTPNPVSERADITIRLHPALPNYGEKFRIIFNAPNLITDGDYYYAEAETTEAELTLNINGNGERSYGIADGWDITSPSMFMRVYISEHIYWLEVSTLAQTFCTYIVSGDPQYDALVQGRHYAGVGNGGTVPITIDDFVFQKHLYDLPICNAKGCYCQGAVPSYPGRNYISRRIELSYFGADGCDCFTNGWAILEWDCLLEKWKCIDGMLCGQPLPITIGDVTDFPHIYCGDPEDLSTWYLDHPLCTIANPCQGYDCVPSSTSCEPFELRWDFNVPMGDLDCPFCGGGNPGSWYVIATEMSLP